MNADLLEVLTVASNRGSFDRAVTRASKTAIRDAEQQELIRVVHTSEGVVGAHYACVHAGYVEQLNDLHLELTPAGVEHLRSA